MTLADKVTLTRLVLAPLAVLGYLLLPVDHSLCFWASGLLCAVAEITDLADGRIARARREVSDFGKLADPFCDVIYRQAMFLALLLPAGGVGWVVAATPAEADILGPQSTLLGHLDGRQLVLALQGGGLGAGLVPWLPVMLMIQREIVAGALRAMAASRGLILAARTSGKVKAWMQGVLLLSVLGFPAVLWSRPPWVLDAAFWASWACALVSVLSIIEYIWVNRATLAQLLERRPA